MDELKIQIKKKPNGEVIYCIRREHLQDLFRMLVSGEVPIKLVCLSAAFCITSGKGDKNVARRMDELFKEISNPWKTELRVMDADRILEGWYKQFEEIWETKN